MVELTINHQIGLHHMGVDNKQTRGADIGHDWRAK